MEDEDEIIRMSFNKFQKLYRFKRISILDGSIRKEKYKTSDLKRNSSNYIKNDYILEFMPYKPYVYYRIKWFFRPLKIKAKEYISVVIAKNKHLFSILKWIFAIIACAASIKYILE